MRVQKLKLDSDPDSGADPDPAYDIVFKTNRFECKPQFGYCASVGFLVSTADLEIGGVRT
jgi:hypothetical protein